MKENKVFRILVINPGSTSTKAAVFENERLIASKTIRHEREELDKYKGNGVYGQKDFRKELVLEFLKESNIDPSSLDAVSGRAGRLPPMESGTYIVDDALMKVIPDPLLSPALLGMIIAREIGDSIGKPSFITDPATVDEITDVARVTGQPEIKRSVQFHALNQKAVARLAAEELGKKYEECRFVVAHIGGGTTIGAHDRGRVVDVNHGSGGEGPMSTERAGRLPGLELVKLCYSGKYTRQEMENIFLKTGGVYAHIGTGDMREVEKRINSGDEKANLIFESFAYNVVKEIGAMYAVLGGDIDGIILTGGIIYSEIFKSLILKRIKKMARIFIYPGEMEMEALAGGALRILSGQEKAKQYIERNM